MDSKTKTNIMIIAGVLVLVALGIGWAIWQENQPSKLDDFAKCLTEKKAIFYGAFWCPHCQSQKSLFGSSKQYLPYTECSTPDSNGVLPVCQDAKITVYPTWKFADGTTDEGEMTLDALANKTGCKLP